MKNGIRVLCLFLFSSGACCGCSQTNTADNNRDTNPSLSGESSVADTDSTSTESDTQPNNSTEETDSESVEAADLVSGSESLTFDDTESGSDTSDETDSKDNTDTDTITDTETVDTGSGTAESSDPEHATDTDTMVDINTDTTESPGTNTDLETETASDHTENTDEGTDTDDLGDSNSETEDGTDVETDTDTQMLSTDSESDSDTVLLNPCDGIDCSGRGRCVLEETQPLCECDEGFIADGLSCNDVDECESDLHGCREDEQCVNLQGSYRCYAGECDPSVPNKISGYPFDVRRVDNHLFVASGSDGVRIYEISADTHLTLVNHLATEAAAYLVRIDNGIAYIYSVIGSVYLIETFDVSDPLAPVPLAIEKLSRSVRDMAVWQQQLILLDQKLSIYGVADPESPVLLSGLTLNQPIKHIAVQDGYVYGASDEGWLIVDIRDEQSAVPVSESYYSDVVTNYDDEPFVAVSDGRLFLNRTRHDDADDMDYSELHIYDLSTPEAPTLAGETALSDLTLAISVNGDRAFLTMEGGGLQVVDISEVANIEKIGEMSGTSPIFTDCGGSDAVCAAWSGINLYLIDVSTPEEIVKSDILAFPSDPRTVAAYGDIAIVVEDNTLFLIDAVSSSTLSIIRRIQFEKPVVDVAVDNDALYISVYDTGLSVLDLSDMLEADAMPIDTPAARYLHLSVSNGYLYALEETYVSGVGTNRNIHIVDIRDPQAPVHTGSVGIPGAVNDALAVGDYVFLQSYYGTALYIVDATDKTAPILSTEYTLPEYTFAGSILGYDSPYLYVGLVDSLTLILDVSNPAQPQELGTIYLHGRPRSYVFDADTMYIIDSMYMLLRLDNADRLHPRYTGQYEVTGDARQVEASNGHLYVTSDGGGLHVIDLSSPPKHDIVDELLPGQYLAAPRVDETSLYIANVNPLDYKDDSSVVRRFDITDVSAPVQTGSYSTDDTRVSRIEVAGDYAYVAAFVNPGSGSYNTGEISVLDVSDASRLSFVDSQRYGYSVFDIQMGDTYGAAMTLYYKSGNTRVWSTVASLTAEEGGPAAATHEIELGSRDPVDIALNGSTVWVADGTDALRVFDLREEGGLSLIASHVLDVAATHIAIDDQNRAFVSALSAIHVFDVTDPSHLTPLSTIDVDGFPSDSIVKGMLVYVLGDFNGESSLRVIDISELTHPGVINTLGYHGNDFDVLADGSIVVTGGYGARIYDPFVCSAQ